MSLRALALNCTLKPSPEDSSCGLLLEQLLGALGQHGVEGTLVRAVDHAIKPGVTADEGAGDAWPQLRQQILEADIFILGTPIWVGHPSSVCQRVIERLDAFLGEQDERGLIPTYGKVACAAIVGNEDGAHLSFARIAQALSDLGFTIPPEGSAYWVGEAMGGVDFKDHEKTPKATAEAVAALGSNAAHLAQALRASPFPSKAAS